MIERKEMLLISVFTLITVLGWIVFDIYHAANKSTIPRNVSNLIVPLEIKVTKEMLEQIRTHVP